MDMINKVTDYLKKTYEPEGIIIYGSYTDGSANENSDFDALVIAGDGSTDENSDFDALMTAGEQKLHDTSVVEGTALDVFVYPPEVFQKAYDPKEFLQVYDGKIVLDEKGVAEGLQRRVRDYIAHIPAKTLKEIQQELDWCEKMLLRTERGDAEGYYRWHWLLTDSAEIYCDILGQPYFGPKKTLRQMEAADGEAFQRYEKALKEFRWEHLADWISYLKELAGSGREIG